MEQLGTIHRLADGVTARVTKRIADTHAYVAHGDRSAAELCARLVGVGSGNAKRAISNATRLEALPVTDAAVREGRLSAQEAELISSAAVHDPTLEAELHLGRHIPGRAHRADRRWPRVLRGGVYGPRLSRASIIPRSSSRRGGPTAGWNLDWMCSPDHERETRGWHLGPPDPDAGKRPLDRPGAYRAA